MGKVEVICILLGLALALTYLQIKLTRTINGIKADLLSAQKAQNDWLFNQLYSMAPGKVLRPDEVEEKAVSKPAKIIHTSRDPMNEFSGKLDDWHG